MGSINRSHNEADGGILLFSGELILLYCDSVDTEVGGKESFKGRVYLTTHRLVVIVAPYRQNAPVKSLCAPFCAIVKCNVEQPIFGANYIEATVRDEADPSKSFSFKLKFSKGGAIELAMAMNRAVAAVGRNYNSAMPPPPAYTPSPSAQYYQAPPTVYAPGYNSGIQMPVQQFPDQPPIGFIYASEAPPPYPGLGGNTGPAQPGANQASPYQQQPHQQQGGYGYPGQQQPAAGLPSGQQNTGYPGAGYPGHGGYPPAQGGYAQQQSADGGYPRQPPASGYPQQQPTSGYPQQQPAGGYPQQPPASGYPQQPPASGYPQQQPSSGYPQQPPPSQSGSPQQQQPGFGFTAQPQQAAGVPTSSVYPDLNEGRRQGYPGNQQNESPGQQQAGGSWPSAPSFNPNWQDDKKNV